MTRLRVRSFLQRWLRGAKRQFTWSGASFFFIITLVALGAFISANNLLFLLLAALLATMLVSGLVSRLSLAGLEVRLILPEHVFAKRTFQARVQLHNIKRWMSSFSIQLQDAEKQNPVRLYFAVIPGGATVDALTPVRFANRGLAEARSYLLTTRFPFGFMERSEEVPLNRAARKSGENTREVVVYPSVDPRAGFESLLQSLEGEMESLVRGRGTDFYRIRPYESSESARHVDWRATAHTGELQVREFAREEEVLVEILLDLDIPPGKEQWLEDAIECAAFLCWRLAARNARLRFATQVFNLRLPEQGDVYGILRYLAQAHPVRTRLPIHPDEDNSFQVVLSLAGNYWREAGWPAAHVVGPDDGGDAPGGADSAARSQA